jgi:hypothetical protein
VYAALSKLFDYEEFKNQLSRSPLIKNLSTTIAIILPATELIVAIMLTIKSLREYGLTLSIVLMIVFTFYIMYMLLFEKNLPCSCGGVLKQMTWKQHLLFNIFFLLTAFTGIIFEKNKNKSQIGF